MINMEKHYDQHYFFSDRFGGKKYTRPNGSVGEFGYHAGGIWNFKSLLTKLIELLGRPQNILDIGAGTGGFVATAKNEGIDALGLEFSKYAIKTAIMNASPLLKYWDVEKTPWPVDKQYDWVTAIDLFEHLFEESADTVIKECKRVAKRFIIAKICTAQRPHEIWSAKKASYEEVYAQAVKEGYEWLIASGHVNSQFPEYWNKKFEDAEWQLRPDLSEKLKTDLHLPEDWRTTIIAERIDKSVKPLPSTFTQSWYDKDYFADLQGKVYRKPDGTITHHGYRNPEGELEAARPIAEAWKEIFQPKNMLDVAAGRGTFIAYARQVGIEAYGFDYSEWACSDEGRYRRCKPEWLKVHNATKPWPYPDSSFDLVTVLDFYEHVYLSDIPFVIKEMYRVAKKWIFLLISTVGGVAGATRQDEPFILEKGQPTPLKLEEKAVLGHVTVQTPEWWLDKLEHDDWILRRDMVTWFVNLVGGPNAITNWFLNTMFILEKI